MTENEKLAEIERNYWGTAEFEGEDYKWMGLRNDDIEFLLKLAKEVLNSKIV